MHTPMLFSAGYPEIPKARGLQRTIVEKHLFLRGDRGAEFAPDFRPRAGELVADGRTGLSAFVGSNLDELLKARGIDTVIVAGFATGINIPRQLGEAIFAGALGEVLSNRQILERFRPSP
jgi:nicotinamidase-related amidase